MVLCMLISGNQIDLMGWEFDGTVKCLFQFEFRVKDSIKTPWSVVVSLSQTIQVVVIDI